jgi:hypothetical protein
MLRQACYLDDLLILINNNFKDHLCNLKVVLTRLSTVELRVNVIIPPNISFLLKKYIGSLKKVFKKVSS